MSNSSYFINKLNMIKHPEGGYYCESYRHPENCINTNKEKRSLSTSIYFLIEEDDASNLHRLKSDEIWYYHSGSPLNIVMISPEGELRVQRLGLDIDKGEMPQVLVAAGSIFGSYVENGYALVGCMVSPGFDFKDFELFERETLIQLYPDLVSVITKLTKNTAK